MDKCIFDFIKSIPIFISENIFLSGLLVYLCTFLFTQEFKQKKPTIKLDVPIIKNKLDFNVGGYICTIFKTKNNKLQYLTYTDGNALFLVLNERSEWSVELDGFLKTIGFTKTEKGYNCYRLEMFDREFFTGTEVTRAGTKGKPLLAFKILSTLSNFDGFSTLKEYPHLVDFINLNKLSYSDKMLLADLHPQLKPYVSVLI